MGSVESDQDSFILVGDPTTGSSFEPGETYSFRVRGYTNVSGGPLYTPSSNVVPVVIADVDTSPTLAAPVSLTATATIASQVSLSWLAGDNSTDEFLVEQSTDGVNFVNIGQVASTSLSFVVNGLQPSTSYEFRVRAANSITLSGYSDVASATTPDPSIANAPPAPTLTATANGYQGFNVSWTFPDGQSYPVALQYRAASDTTFSGENISSGNSVTISALPGTLYYFRAAALNSAQLPSAFSATISAQNRAAPGSDLAHGIHRCQQQHYPALAGPKRRHGALHHRGIRRPGRQRLQRCCNGRGRRHFLFALALG